MNVEPSRFLNYPGDKRAATFGGGPTWDGHRLVPVDAVYDFEADQTQVGFATVAEIQRAAAS